MKITLVRFRHYDGSTTFEFPRSQLTLISAASGGGKSTIFEAILWCLYGGMTHIYPSGTSGTKDVQTCVLLEFPELGGLCIRRKRPPETLEVCTPSPEGYKMQVDAAGQAQIDAIFGSRDLWLASAYMQQLELSPLVALPNSQRFQLLHELTFGGGMHAETDTPDYYTGKVETVLLQTKDYISKRTGYYNGLAESYTRAATTPAMIEAFTLWGERKALASVQADELALSMQVKELRVKYQQAREIEVRLADLEATYITSLKQVNSLKERLQPLEPLITEQSTLRVLVDKHAVYSQVSRLHTELTEKRKRVPVLSKHLEMKEAQIEEAQHILTKLLDQYAAFTILNTTPVIFERELKQCEHQLQEYTDQRQAFTRYEKELQRLKDDRAVVEVEYTKTCADLKAVHVEMQKEADRIKVYNDTIAETYMAQCDTRRLQIERYERYERDLATYQRLMKQRADLAPRLEDAVMRRDLQTAWYKERYPDAPVETKLHELQQLLKELVCPHCQQGVTLVGPSLIKGHSTLEMQAVAKEAIGKIQAWLASVKDAALLQSEWDRLPTPSQPDKIEPAPPPPTPPKYKTIPNLKLVLPPKPTFSPLPTAPRLTLDEKSAERLTQRYEKLKTLVVPALEKTQIDTELVSLKALPLYHEFTLQLEALTTQLKALDQPDLAVTTRLKAVEALLIEQHQLRGQITALEAKLVPPTLTPPQPSSKMWQVDIESLETQQKTLTYLIQAGTKVTELTGQKLALDQLQVEIKQYADYEANLVRLKNVISEVATNAMEIVIADINETLNLVLKELFDDDIRVILSTHKQLKTKERTKLEVNLQIHYRSVEYDSIKYLSGGEQKRILFALLIAMAKRNASPIIIIDEGMSVLDAKPRERCLKALRLHLPTKTVINVCHEIVEGFHDNTLRVTK